MLQIWFACNNLFEGQVTQIFTFKKDETTRALFPSFKFCPFSFFFLLFFFLSSLTPLMSTTQKKGKAKPIPTVKEQVNKYEEILIIFFIDTTE